MNKSTFSTLVGIFLLAMLVTLGGCGGGGGGDDVVATDIPRYAYVANVVDYSVSSYVVHADTGHLKWIGKTPIQGQPRSVALHPNGQSLYVTKGPDSGVSQFDVNADGTLTPKTQPVSYTPGEVTNWIAVHPNGDYAYVANTVFTSSEGRIGQYDIDADGNLTAMDPDSVTTGDTPTFIAIGPNSTYVYALNSGDNSVWQFSINADGSLSSTPHSTVSPGASVRNKGT